MQKRVLALVSLLALFATSCGGGEPAEDGDKDATPAAKAQTFTVNVDGKTDKFNLATLAYFPNELSVHPGDTVKFEEIFTGEPHTVTFGTLVDAALDAVDKLGPPGGPSAAASPNASPTSGASGAGESPTSAASPTTGSSPTSAASPTTGSSPAAGSTASPGASPGAGGGGAETGATPPEMMKLPDIFGPPPTFDPLNQSAAQVCFLETGDPPASPKGGSPACPKAEQPDFNGNQTFYNSGYLAEDEDFTVKFADDVKPGSYSFICLVHREGMRGKVNVAADDAEIASPSEVKKDGEDQLQKRVESLGKVREDMQKATADKALAGAASPKFQDAQIAEFGPTEASVPVGGTVTWSVFLFHTISLNGPEDAVGDLIQESDGSLKQNPKAVAPSKAPKPPPIVFGPGGKPSTVQATWDGTGYFNSGILASFPGAEVTYKIRFTKAGTYQLQCNLHPDMEGTVKVG